jgi:hypothetical protein
MSDGYMDFEDLSEEEQEDYERYEWDEHAAFHERMVWEHHHSEEERLAKEALQEKGC